VGNLVLIHGPSYRKGSSNVPDDDVYSVVYRILLVVGGTYLIGLGGLMAENLHCLDARVDVYVCSYPSGVLMCEKYSGRRSYMTAVVCAYMPNY
jgi:hypothetical protein